jgi:2-polyprenyl-3-methyl-5-hydroxy-6-metoxy-1,4-benzoquinol methylase
METSGFSSVPCTTCGYQRPLDVSRLAPDRAAQARPFIEFDRGSRYSSRSVNEAPPAPGSRQHHYEQKSTGYSAGSARKDRVLQLVGGPGLRVLDVACGSGHLGERIREHGNRVVGVEIAESSAAEARRVLDEVHVFDIEQPWPTLLREAPFDVVVLGEVLEHVFDPVAVLTEVRKCLTANGRIVITTPNFMVWIARLQYLFGRFRYQRYGLFDFGHIRWFTHDYLLEVVKQGGFVIEHERHLAHPPALQPLVRSWPGVFALTFVVSARRADAVPS